MTITNIIDICGGRLIQSGPDHEVNSILTDSRKVSNTPSVVFFAIRGINHDGHAYLPDLIEKGVRTFVIETQITSPISEDVNLILVESSLLALQNLACSKMQTFDKPVIGIAGSIGKTIVKEWLSTMLSDSFRVIKSPRSYNSQLGVPLSVWKVSDQYDVGVFEAGISQPGEMQRLQAIIQPTHGILTNIGTAHAEGFSSVNEKLGEKLRLFEDCQLLIYNADNPLVRAAINEMPCPPRKTISWAFQEGADIHVTPAGQSFYEFSLVNERLTLRLPFEDDASIENIVHCICMLREFGLSTKQMQLGLDQLEPVDMRLKLIKGVHDSYVIDDSYNNDLAGLERALNFLSHQNQYSKKVVILSDILQEGSSAKLYTSVNKLLIEKQVDQFIGVGSDIMKHAALFTLKSRFYPDTTDLLNKLSQLNLHQSVILVKGARKFQFERVVSNMAEKTHQTILEINLDAITRNLNFYRSELGDKVKVMVMVKAFAYGSGSTELAQLLQFHKVHYLGVAYADEGASLRKNGIHLPIMVMNTNHADLHTLIDYQLEPEIFEMNQLITFQKHYEDKAISLPIHININTGMNRMGFESEELEKLTDFISTHTNIQVKSIFTHLAGADEAEHNEFSLNQLNTFKPIAEKIADGLKEKPLIHALNSAGIIRFPDYHMDMVRLGIGLYGLEASGLKANELRTVGTLKTTISQVKDIKFGETVGYSRKGVAHEPTRIATVAIGYADGYSRAFSNGVGTMYIDGQPAPIIGNICMDMTMLDVTGLGVKRGDEVIVFGDVPHIETLASEINTIPYEILTNISERVKRVYLTK